MCALCGALGGGPHWTDGPDTGPDPAQRRRERARRVRIANRVLAHYGLSLQDWQASAYVLSTATGSSEVIADFAHLWAAAERLSGRRCDPLDPALLAALHG